MVGPGMISRTVEAAAKAAQFSNDIFVSLSAKKRINPRVRGNVKSHLKKCAACRFARRRRHTGYRVKASLKTFTLFQPCLAKLRAIRPVRVSRRQRRVWVHA